VAKKTTIYTIYRNENPDTGSPRNQVNEEPPLNHKNENWVQFNNTRPNPARIIFTTSCPLERFDPLVPAGTLSDPFKVDHQLDGGEFHFCVYFDGAAGENDVCPTRLHSTKGKKKAKATKKSLPSAKETGGAESIKLSIGDDPQIIIG
jgi:hypothetical protein